MADEKPTIPSKFTLLMDLLNVLLADIKDAKTLSLRLVSVFFGLVCYFLVSNQNQIVEIIKNYSDSNSIVKVKEARDASYPAVAKEKAAFMYSLIGADFVGILDYKPPFQNNQADLVAFEGKVPIDVSLWKNIPINKNSTVYSMHLKQEAYYNKAVEDKQYLIDIESFIPKKLYKPLELNYIYSYPVYDLVNSYSGAIIIGWKDQPIGDKDDVVDFINSIVYPNARALGRAK